MLSDAGGNGGVCQSVRISVTLSRVRRTTLSPTCPLKEDAGLREKLQGAGDLDAAMTLAKEAGFDVSKADWLRYQAKQNL